MPKEITIANGVKIVFEEDCNECIVLREVLQTVERGNDSKLRLIQELNALTPKTPKNSWDQGYNQCLADIQKRLYKWSQGDY